MEMFVGKFSVSKVWWEILSGKKKMGEIGLGEKKDK